MAGCERIWLRVSECEKIWLDSEKMAACAKIELVVKKYGLVWNSLARCGIF